MLSCNVTVFWLCLYMSVFIYGPHKDLSKLSTVADNLHSRYIDVLYKKIQTLYWENSDHRNSYKELGLSLLLSGTLTIVTHTVNSDCLHSYREPSLSPLQLGTLTVSTHTGNSDSLHSKKRTLTVSTPTGNSNCLHSHREL